MPQEREQRLASGAAEDDNFISQARLLEELCNVAAVIDLVLGYRSVIEIQGSQL